MLAGLGGLQPLGWDPPLIQLTALPAGRYRMEGGCDLKGEWVDLKVIGQDVVHDVTRLTYMRSTSPPPVSL